ncbi:hypothetical protein FG05_02729 [Fusarium graminearum]|nr:hypothetical protein FG05_02729 [Fusarium graminearum]
MSGFGDFTTICETAPLPLCAAVGPVLQATGRTGIEPECYARNIELANTIIFEGATAVMHIVALVMTVIMILHVRSKFTAVGRKEILSFFYLYMLLSAMSLVIDAGVVPPGSDPYPYLVSVQNGFSSAVITCLLINGFVGFQLYEDGTPLSVWMLRISTLAAFTISFLVSLATFKSWAGLSPTNTYWDSITKEDLEFSVGTRMNNWEVKELLPEEERRATVFSEDLYGQNSSYDLPYSPGAARYSAKY